MLTPTDKKNIKNFKNLKVAHQRTFKHRLIKKCVQFPKDLKFVLLHYEQLNLKIGKLINPLLLFEIIELYENLSKLQNV